MAKTICERTRNGVPVEMVMDVDFLITVRCMKQGGKKRDKEHDLDEFMEVEPFLANEILERASAFDPMSCYLQSFVEQAWEEAEMLDPWYREDY
jgi:hypothetical protein